MNTWAQGSPNLYFFDLCKRSTKEQKRKTVLELGGDFKYSLASNLTADLTYNTDFAQVEADQEYVNLSRYSIFSLKNAPSF